MDDMFNTAAANNTINERDVVRSFNKRTHSIQSNCLFRFCYCYFVLLEHDDC
jgi:hypothetical protein